MPQIAQLAETYSSQIFWLLVIFGLVFFVIGRGMVPRVMDTVALRDKQISDDLAAARAARDAADEQEETWRQRESDNRSQAQGLISDAKTKAAVETEARLAEAQQRIDARLDEAAQRIATARDQAAAEIENVASEAARDIVAKLAGITVEPDAAAAAVKEIMANG